MEHLEKAAGVGLSERERGSVFKQMGEMKKKIQVGKHRIATSPFSGRGGIAIFQRNAATATVAAGGGRAEGGVRGLREREGRQQGEGEEAQGGDQGPAGQPPRLHRLQRARAQARAGQAAPAAQRAQEEVRRGCGRGEFLATITERAVLFH